ncbi:MAG: hypothetical protein QF554_07760 [Dehalococcoidia bacterium]|nr:hypothetical protein [Dehalococcoidia bacterium]
MTQDSPREMRRSSSAPVSALTAVLLMLLVIACSSGGDDPAAADDIFLFVNFTDVAPGENRLPFALRRADGGKLDLAPESVTLTYEKRDSGIVKTAPTARFRPWPVGRGIFTTTATYDSAGLWDFTATISSADGSTSTATAVRQVKDVTSTPPVGSPAPVVATRTGSTPGELALITSDANPIPELYAISFDDALAEGKPVVITFGTPAWCTSLTCGPQLSTVDQVRQNHIGEAAFIHVELFDNPDVMRESGDPLTGIEAPAVRPWGLPSEPWTFIIDGDGLIAAKFEAYTTADELEEALAEVLGAG